MTTVSHVDPDTEARNKRSVQIITANNKLYKNIKPPTITKDHDQDYEAGRRYAFSVMPLMTNTCGPTYLSWMLAHVCAMPKRRGSFVNARGEKMEHLSAVEEGFMAGLGELILRWGLGDGFPPAIIARYLGRAS